MAAYSYHVSLIWPPRRVRFDMSILLARVMAAHSNKGVKHSYGIEY